MEGNEFLSFHTWQANTVWTFCNPIPTPQNQMKASLVLGRHQARETAAQNPKALANFN